MKLSKKIALGLTLSFLTACGTLSHPAPQVVRQTPDPAWTVEVRKPLPQGRDNAALAAWAKALSDALDTANASLASIRAWAEAQ